MPQYVVCVPTQGTPSLAPCADAGGVTYSPVMMELPAPGAVSYDQAAEQFAYGFTAVLTIWLVGIAIGSILRLLR